MFLPACCVTRHGGGGCCRPCRQIPRCRVIILDDLGGGCPRLCAWYVLGGGTEGGFPSLRPAPFRGRQDVAPTIPAPVSPFLAVYPERLLRFIGQFVLRRLPVLDLTKAAGRLSGRATIPTDCGP